MLTSSKKIFFLLLIFSIQIFSQSPDPIRGKNGMVVSASKLASKIGVEILKQGGNAIDAAVATGFALAVVYPSAGNIGGGGFMVIHLQNGINTTIDYREKAPLSSKTNMYLDSLGNFNSELSQFGVTSVGVPGSVAGLLYALKKYGTMSLTDIMQPAIDLAKNGFDLDYRMAESLKFENDYFNKYESSKKIFTKNGLPFVESDKLTQNDFANTLKIIRDYGNDGFYDGKIAKLIVDQIKNSGGYLTLEDLKNYKPIERETISTDYNGYEVFTMGPPSGGGVSLLQMLNILENHKFSPSEWGSGEYMNLLVETMKYVFADRSKYLGDPDFYRVPLKWLLSKKYAREIFDKISDTAISSKDIFPGNPSSYKESEETTHYSVIDKFGNAVSTTTTLNSSYGSKIVVEGAGFLLNNEMDDFSSKPGAPNQFGLIGSEANKIEPGKRMLSSMCPTIILKNNKPFLVLGSPGGSTIPTVVLQVILNVIDFGMDIQEAIDKPRIHHQWLPDRIDYEKFGLTQDVKSALIKMGQFIGEERILGRVEGIEYDNQNKIFLGASDPRGFGAAIGY